MIGFTANRCRLRAECLGHACVIGTERLAVIHAPGEVLAQRAPALRFGGLTGEGSAERGLGVLLATEGLRPTADARARGGLFGQDLEQWNSIRRTYDLRRLRSLGLIERLPGRRH